VNFLTTGNTEDTGSKNSFFGDLYAQGRDGAEFYTDKNVSERCAKEHSRKF
jgi:hypothetical protein